jgi:hypothetical protein
MEKRTLIPASLLIQAVRSGTNKVTMAMIHPDDMSRVDMVHLRIFLGCEILPQHDVERGYLYIDTKQLR